MTHSTFSSLLIFPTWFLFYFFLKNSAHRNGTKLSYNLLSQKHFSIFYFYFQSLCRDCSPCMAKKILKIIEKNLYRNKTQIIMHKFLMMLQKHRKMFHITGCLCHSTLASSRDLHFFLESDETKKNVNKFFKLFYFSIWVHFCLSYISLVCSGNRFMYEYL